MNNNKPITEEEKREFNKFLTDTHNAGALSMLEILEQIITDNNLETAEECLGVINHFIAEIGQQIDPDWFEEECYDNCDDCDGECGCEIINISGGRR